MRTRIALLALAFVGACDASGSGTSVGNPGKTTMRVAEADGIEYGALFAEVETVVFDGCDEGTEQEEIVVEEDLDLLDDDNAIDTPVGTWCFVEVQLASTLFIEGNGDEGGELELELEIGELGLEGEFTGADNSFVLEVGAPGWLTATEFGLGTGVEVELGPESAQHDDIVVRVDEQSAVYADANGDGDLDDDERNDVVAGSGFEPSDDDDDADGEADGGRCSSVSAPASASVTLLAMLLAASRRR